MLTDPAPDHLVIGLYADTALLDFVLSGAGMGLHILQAGPMQFGLKTAVLARGLLVPDELAALLAAGEAIQQQATTGPPAPAPPAGDDPAAGRPLWSLTLPEVVMIATAADFAASAYLSELGAEMREVQVTHNGIPAEVFEAQMNETMHYLGRFQDEWRELFGEYPSYRQRMAELAGLRAEFAE